MKNSNTEEIYHLDGDGSVVSLLFFLHRQFFDIMVDVITIKRLLQELLPMEDLPYQLLSNLCHLTIRGIDASSAAAFTLRIDCMNDFGISVVLIYRDSIISVVSNDVGK